MRPALILVIALNLLPRFAAASSVTIESHPSHDPDEVVTCTLRLDPPAMRVVEVRGVGRPLPAPATWIARPEDEARLLEALGALMSGDLAAADPAPGAWTPPRPPYLTVVWTARTTGGLARGIYRQDGRDLPPVLARLVAQVMPGGLCARGSG